jgi:catechol 2,3-dioxygenase-like lactoylglutathione lyase family enzyme
VDVTHVFAGLPVSDLDEARGWYLRLLGREPDRTPKPGEAVWQLTATALLYVVEDRARAGGGLLTVAVDGLDRQRTELDDRGIPSQSETLANGIVKLTVHDPDGNTISFFEAPGSDASAG